MVMSYKKSKAGGGNYYVNCQLKNVKGADDYYANSSAKEPPGEWFVAGLSDQFGIEDGAKFTEADADRFRALCNGFHPETGEALTQNSGHPKRVALHDFTLSAPKSVSVIWSQASDALKRQIEEAQNQASREAMQFLSEKGGYTRIGKAGESTERINLCGALFGHGSSRENDPQLHTHCVILNAAERANGSFGSIETKEIFAWMGAAASLYHSSLSSKLAELGLEIEKEERLFEVAGVPEKVAEAFSQRRTQILEQAQKMALERGMTTQAVLCSKGLMQEAALETRDQKSEKTRDELQEEWLQRGHELGFTAEEVDKLINTDRHQPLTPAARELLTHGVEEDLTATTATFAEPLLYAAVAVRLIGRGGRNEVEEAVSEIKDRLRVCEFKNGKKIFTTKEMIDVEDRMIQLAGVTDSKHVMKSDVVDAAIERNSKLTKEQADAVRHALLDTKRVSVIQGSAGSGKTFSLRTVAEVYKQQGYELHALATPWAAAENLKREAGLDTHRAIAGWLRDIDAGVIALNEKSMIIVDEAGMVSARDMEKILHAANKCGAKVILTGDDQQLHSLQAGDALRTISEQYGCARIDLIQRQKNKDGSINKAQVEAIKKMFDGDSKEAMVVFKDHIHLSTGADATNKKMFDAWCKSKNEYADESHLMIAKRNSDVNMLNEWSHEYLKTTGVVDASKSISVRAVESSKKRPVIEFCKGDEIQFRNNQQALGVFNRTRGVITDIDGPTIFLKTKDGKDVKLDTRDSLWYMHGTNDLALQHAYSVTAYASQGQTVDRVFVRDTVNIDRRSISVAMSRHKYEVNVFADRAEHYTKMMVDADKKDWRSPEKVSDKEILGHMQGIWEESPVKTSTLDYVDIGWVNASSTQYNVMYERQMRELKEARVEIDRVREQSRGAVDLSFQKEPGYSIEARLPKIDESQAMQGRADLVRSGISGAVILRAERQGALCWAQQNDEKIVSAPTFIGKNAGGRAVNAVSEPDHGEQIRTDGGLRHRYPPILQGDSAEIHVCTTGRDALAIWTEYEEQNKPLPTVIIAGDKADSLVHEQTQMKLMEADKVVIHESMQVGPEHLVQRASIEKSLDKSQIEVVQHEQSPTHARAQVAHELALEEQKYEQAQQRAR